MTTTHQPADEPTTRASAGPPRKRRRKDVAPAPTAPETAAVGKIALDARGPGLYSTHVGKKYAMAVSGIVLLLFVFVHMLGNLKLYLGAGPLDAYSRWLRTAGEPALPRETLLWAVRIVLLAAVVVHVQAAYSLTRVNRRARPEAYRSPRDYVAASFASRTMRWTGIIVALFVVFHLLDLTWGTANPDFRAGDPYHNVVESFQRWPVAIAYIVANLALATHLYHGAGSLFQSIGLLFRRRRAFATAFAAVIAAGNISFPLAVLTGVVS
ncbi:MAG: succinate dehydrogenase/fumarate reductase cytochrome b subunit, b558 family [Actinomycetia bacterium]|nr:succinate dehydrogenase/fumarate reductase cytochrome b subunit, b558 family [Actinomycetes bacterium]